MTPTVPNTSCCSQTAGVKGHGSVKIRRSGATVGSLIVCPNKARVTHLKREQSNGKPLWPAGVRQHEDSLQNGGKSPACLRRSSLLSQTSWAEGSDEGDGPSGEPFRPKRLEGRKSEQSSRGRTQEFINTGCVTTWRIMIRRTGLNKWFG